MTSDRHTYCCQLHEPRAQVCLGASMSLTGLNLHDYTYFRVFARWHVLIVMHAGS